MEQKNRSIIIDLMRLVGLILVTIFHLYDYKATYFGVLIFFVLSGYLITESLETSGRNYVEFIVNRIKKIYPPMIAMILLSIIMYLFINGNITENLISTSIYTLLGVSNIYQIANGISYFDNYSTDILFKHSWALAIEIQFYIFFPFIIYICNMCKKSKFSKKLKPMIILILALISQMVMIYKLKITPDYTYLYYATETRISSLLIGALFYYIPYDKLKLNKVVSYLIIIGAVVLFFACSFYFDYKSAFNYLGGMFLISCTVSIFLVESKRLNLNCNNFLLKKMSTVGKHSYTYYLLQYPIMIFAREYFKWSEIDYSISVFIQIVILFIFAEVFYYIFEKGSNSMQLKKIIVLLTAYILTIFNAPVIKATDSDNLEKIMSINDTLVAKTENNSIKEISLSEEYNKEASNKKNLSDDGREYITYNGENFDEIDLLEQRFLEDRIEESIIEYDKPKDKIEKKVEKSEISENKKNIDKNEEKNKEVIKLPGKKRITFIGDSVMKMAENQLKKDFEGSFVDAKVSRQFVVLPDLLRTMEKQGQLNDIVVIHLGTNGVINKKAFDDTISILKNKRVYFINCVVPKHWEKSINSSISEWAKEYPNVKVIDWYKVAKGKRELFYNDATHLKPEGVKAYISLISENVK